MMTLVTSSRRSARASAQRGATILIALMTMAAMALVAVAMYRSVDIATLQSGNVALIADQNNRADLCVRRAITWLTDTSSGLDLSSSSDLPAFNYRATRFNPVDIDTTYGVPKAMLTSAGNNAWMGTAPDIVSSDGTKVNCVIERLCSLVGDAQLSSCQMGTVGQADTTAGNKDTTLTGYPLFRVTTRVDGVKGVAFLQVTLGPRSS